MFVILCRPVHLHYNTSPMKRLLTPVLCLSVAFLLSACNRLGGGGSASSSSSSAVSSEDIPETHNVTYRGTVQELGVTITMQGTHALALGDGRMLILESSAVDLETYLDHEVEVFGSLRPTVEAGGIIMRVERITDFSPDSSESSATSVSSLRSSSMSSAMTSTTSSVSVAATSRSSAVSVVSSARSSVASSQALSSAPASTDAGMEARIVLMSKQDMNERNWTQQYCSEHVGFCVPVHRNWWFVSFGNTTRTLWHVEVSSESIEAMGSGPVVIDLIGGDLSGHSDGEVSVSGGIATGYRSWTQGRHIEIKADARLEAAVRYMTENLRATDEAS